MKRQRPYGDDLDDDRRRFYDRGPAPPPPAPPRRRQGDYDGDVFDRRKGFGSGGGGFYDHRHRDSPSPRGYGGDRAMHRSESFSGFRREFPKGFRSERDRSRRDGSGSSSWRRPGGGWRDSDGLDGYRTAPRRSGASLPTPPLRSPSEPSRRLDGAKVEKSRKQSSGIAEMEEGEVAPDLEPHAQPAAVEHRKQAESGHAKERLPERGEVGRVDSAARGNSGTHGKGVIAASAAENAGKDEGRRKDGVITEAGKATNVPLDKSGSNTAVKVGGGDEVRVQDEIAAAAVRQVEQSISSGMPQKAPQEEVITQDETANAVHVIGQRTSSIIHNKEAIQEKSTTQFETDNAVDEAAQDTSSSMQQGLQAEVTALAEAADAVQKGSLSGMLQEEVRDGAADVVDSVKTGTPSGVLQRTMQEEVKSQDGNADTGDVLEQTPHSGMLKEAIHEGEMLLNKTADTIDVVGQSNSSLLLEEAMHEKVTVEEGSSNALDIAEKSNSSSIVQELLQEEVMTSPCQEAPVIKRIEKGTTSDNKMGGQIESVASLLVDEALEKDHCENTVALDETKVAEQEVAADHEIAKKQVKVFGPEAKSVGANLFLQPTKEHNQDSKGDGTTLNLIMGKASTEDKGKGIAFDVLSREENIGGGSSVRRAFDLALQTDIDKIEVPKSTGITSVKQEDDTVMTGRLDLSLSLSGGLQNPEFKCLIPISESVTLPACSQPLPSSSFVTNSDGFTASISMTNSQTLAHNSSCSLSQQSLHNYEHSVSKPLFHGVDKVGNSTKWQAQLSNASTHKREATGILQNRLKYGHLSDNTLVGVNAQNNGISNDLQRRPGIPGVLSPTHSRGSHDSGFEHSKRSRQLTRERSSSSLTKGERKDGQRLVLNGAGVIERIISKIVSEPLHQTGRMLEEMTSNSVTYLREAISEVIVDTDKRGRVVALREALKRRSDLNNEMLQRCPRVLLEILVAIRTGLPDFIKKSSSISTSDLVDIFLYLKCRNLSCQSILPADDCDCKICQQKTGFCSSCMCIVCSKFDMASNTCSWVGCDVCLHWCHTDCGLRHSLIRKGGSGSRSYGTSEMQFHCAACGHPSEMFGFVKEVFRTCANQWRMDTLIRELQYVERIFSSSDDTMGKRVRDFVKQMLVKLENKAYYPDVVKYVLAFFSDDDSNLGSGPSVPLKGIPCSIAEGIDGIPSSSRKAPWLPSVTLEGVPFLEKVGALPTTGSRPSTLRKFVGPEFQTVDSKPAVDELDGLVRLKQAEANMYQERANDARKEADNLKHIAMAKYARIEEHYATQIAELHINELQERRKQKIEELQVIERAHHQFVSMKTRMEANIRELLLKMEATKQNLGT